MNTSPKRILVADDYPDAADATAELLRIAGYEVVSAYDGAQALEAARTFRPQLVILDLDMPVMDGFATARALRSEQGPGVRLILIAHTGRNSALDERSALEAGFDRYVKKPVLGNELCDLVAAYLADPVAQTGLPLGHSRPVIPAMTARGMAAPSKKLD